MLVWLKGAAEGQATCRPGRERVRRAAVRRIEGSMAMDGPQLAGARADLLPRGGGLSVSGWTERRDARRGFPAALKVAPKAH